MSNDANMDILETFVIPRRTMVLFLVVDTSGSMMGSKIGTVNSVIEEIIPLLKDVADKNADAQLKIAVLEFASGAQWLTPNGPIELENFIWNDMDASGVTDLGDACSKLNEALSVGKGFMKAATGSFAPVIFLLSDGGPTDDYNKGLDALKQNNWFKKAIKVAVAIGEDADKFVLEEFVGNAEAVLEARNPKMLRKHVKFVTVRASEVASKSANVGDGDYEENKQDTFIAELNNFKIEAADSADADDDDIW
ncbi:MAG: VWA domain-containing protein [Clostridiales Family XIII bacterium]|jgi:uncharacterized protein YegL|nr:VWA domain-containing protein [Clostridiales Family XIII bacterium]